MSATAALAAAGEIVLFRHASEFHGFRDVATNGFLDLLHLLLGFEEAAHDGVLHEVFPFLFERIDFFPGERDALVLFMMQVLSSIRQGMVSLTRVIIGEESLYVAPQDKEIGLADNDLTKFAGLREHRSVIEVRMHVMFFRVGESNPSRLFHK